MKAGIIRRKVQSGVALHPAALQASTDGDQGDALAFIVAGDALGVGVEGEDAVNEKCVAVVAVF